MINYCTKDRNTDQKRQRQPLICGRASSPPLFWWYSRETEEEASPAAAMLAELDAAKAEPEATPASPEKPIEKPEPVRAEVEEEDDEGSRALTLAVRRDDTGETAAEPGGANAVLCCRAAALR